MWPHCSGETLGLCEESGTPFAPCGEQGSISLGHFLVGITHSVRFSSLICWGRSFNPSNTISFTSMLLHILMGYIKCRISFYFSWHSGRSCSKVQQLLEGYLFGYFSYKMFISSNSHVGIISALEVGANSLGLGRIYLYRMKLCK